MQPKIISLYSLTSNRFSTHNRITLADTSNSDGQTKILFLIDANCFYTASIVACVCEGEGDIVERHTEEKWSPE